MTNHTINIAAITFDCRDAARVAGFWAEALQRPVADGANAEFAALAGEPGLAFQAVPEHKQLKNRVHLDLQSGDRDAAVQRLIALGATVHADHSDWVTMRDVEDNEFCVL